MLRQRAEDRNSRGLSGFHGILFSLQWTERVAQSALPEVEKGLVGGVHANKVDRSIWLPRWNLESLQAGKRLSERRDALNDPEHRDSADGVGRHLLHPVRQFDADSTCQPDDGQDRRNEQDLSRLDTYIKEE